MPRIKRIPMTSQTPRSGQITFSSTLKVNLPTSTITSTESWIIHQMTSQETTMMSRILKSGLIKFSFQLRVNSLIGTAMSTESWIKPQRTSQELTMMSKTQKYGLKIFNSRQDTITSTKFWMLSTANKQIIMQMSAIFR